MNRQETIEAMCEILTLAHHACNNWDNPCDCVCGMVNLHGQEPVMSQSTVDWVRQAVVERFERERNGQS